MNILFLEDSGYVANLMKKGLESQGHMVFHALGINDAQSYLESEHIDCFIIDTNMDPSGLKQELIDQSHDGTLSGWLWLKEYVFNEKKNKEEKDVKKKTIIFSEYIQELKLYAEENDLQGIRLISKKDSSSPAEQVLNHLKVIESNMRKD